MDGSPVGPRWSLVWWLSIGQVVTWGTFYYSFSLFIAPMERDLGWSKAELNGALSLGLLVAGLASLPIGVWMDRHGGRLSMTVLTAIGGALLFIWGRTDSLWVFYALWAVMGVVQAATLYEPAFAVLTANMGGEYRRAITYLTLMGGYASTVFMPLTEVLINWLGWRDALTALALCNLPLCAGLHWWILRGTVGGDRTAPRPAGDRCPLRRAMRMPAFWGVLVALASYGATFGALTFHIIPMLEEGGMSRGTIVAIIAMIGPMQVVGRLILMVAGDRIDSRWIGRIAIVCLPAAILLLILAPRAAGWLALFACIYGLGNGMMTIARAIVVPELISKDGYATINGALTLSTNLVRAVAPAAAALLYELMGGYPGVLWVLLVFGCIGAVALWLAARARSTA
jgi:predicted MFS family arabinose efflux permease